jgi:hypothetical protein
VYLKNGMRFALLAFMSSVAAVSTEIRRYCASHPHAMDSIEGIALWLVIQRCGDAVRPRRDDVQEAVELLVKEGVLVRYERENGACVYGCRHV